MMTNLTLGLLGMLLTVFGAVMLWRQRRERNAALLREQRAAAAHAEGVRLAGLLDAAIAEHAAFERCWNERSKVRYDKHLRRRAILFRLQQKLKRPLTPRETLAVKERVS